MLTVHHLGVSQSERVVWLCEELGLNYELKLYKREPTGAGPPAYKALHPAGGAPIITDGSLTLPESGAAIEYIAHKHGGGRLIVAPSDPNWPHYLYWFHACNGSLLPAIQRAALLRRTNPEADTTAVDARRDTFLDLAEQRLSEAAYFGGPALSVADIMNAFTFLTAQRFFPLDLTNRPATRAYAERIAARPAYQRAREKAASVETWPA